MAHGGHGCISVTCNVAPETFAAFMNDCMNGRWTAAREKQDQLIRLHKALFLDASPAPTKFALASLGLCTEDVRLPVTPCAEAVRPAILQAMHAAGVDALPGRRAVGAK
jgi:4-hydroxy-tetrahydrodipicolinate synthase